MTKQQRTTRLLHALAFAALAGASLCAGAQQMKSAGEILKELNQAPVEDGSKLGFRAGTVRPDPTTRRCEKALPKIANTESAFRNLFVIELPRSDLPVEFDVNESTLRPEGRAQLDALAGAMRDATQAGKSYAVAGHTDKRGTEEYNDRLSCDRARAAKAYLVQQHKISEDRLVPMGYGFNVLAVPRDPLAAANRRVEISVLKP